MLYSKEEVADFASQQFAYLLVEEKENILTITLNRPHKKNAMNPVMLKEIAYALSYAHHQQTVWVVVFEAKGDVFCAGADLKAFASGKSTSESSIPAPKEAVVVGDLFRKLHKPCIAKVHAPVYAGGFLLIGGCTHVVANKNAFFSLPEVKRGLWPMQVMQTLLDILPAREVLDWCMRAKKISANKAFEMGLVTQLVDNPDDLTQAVKELCTDICQYSPTAIRFGLKAYQELQTKKAEEAHTYLQGMLLQVLQTEDAIEGIMAFKEKRKAVWQGKAEL